MSLRKLCSCFGLFSHIFFPCPCVVLLYSLSCFPFFLNTHHLLYRLFLPSFCVLTEMFEFRPPIPQCLDQFGLGLRVRREFVGSRKSVQAQHESDAAGRRDPGIARPMPLSPRQTPWCRYGVYQASPPSAGGFRGTYTIWKPPPFAYLFT
jgi:hypothetical protein